MIISKCSYIKLIVALPFFSLLAFTWPVLSFYQFVLGVKFISESKEFSLIILSIISLYPIWVFTLILIRASIYGGAFLFLKNGKICYLSELFKSFSIPDIKSVSVKVFNYGFYKQSSIKIELESGKVKYIPASILRDKPIVISNKISELLSGH